MSQFLSQVPRHLLSQQQKLTPQQIQSLNILQLDLLGLESRIEQELDENPALERVVSDESPAGPAEAAPTLDTRSEEERPMVVDENDQTADFERLDSLVRDYGWGDDEFEYQGRRSRDAIEQAGDVKMDAMANTPSRPASLQEHLKEQWSLADMDERTRCIGAQMIEHLAESGRLETPLEQIAERIDPPPTQEEMLAALARVQELDPPGVAARDIRECLLLQLRALPGDNSLERRIIGEYFEDLQRNRLPQIAKSLDVDLDELKAAIHVISRLSLHPGEQLGDRDMPTILPDVLVEYDAEQDRYTVSLARGASRELRISPEFRQALEESRDDKQTREFLRQKLDSAKALIDAVRFRRERLLDVARSVVAAQRDFLDRGEQHLRVLRMGDLAAELGCDPSTISRTVDGKYLETPRGVFALRKFFTGGAEAGNGEVLGWDSIKAKVKEIVDAEDKRRPLNDDQIVERLKREGIEIKRRTVAKYRQQLDLPTARQRRQY
jgi:RNA polymerase sigma-54 factor